MSPHQLELTICFILLISFLVSSFTNEKPDNNRQNADTDHANDV